MRRTEPKVPMPAISTAPRKPTAVLGGAAGLYLTLSPIAVPPAGLIDGNNFRVQHGNYNNRNLGYSPYNAIQLTDGMGNAQPCTFIDDFALSDGTDRLILGSPIDLFYWNGSSLAFITPVYVTGTASASGTAVTGTGTAWNTAGNTKAGDYISFGSNAQYSPTATWLKIQSVNSDTSITLTTSAGSISNGNYTIRHVFSGTISSHWDADSMLLSGGTTDLYFATNGVDFIVKWDGSNNPAVYKTTWTGGMTLKCAHIRRFANTMIFANVTVNGTLYPTSFVNSDIGNAETTVGGLAGQFLVHDEADAIADLWRLGDNLVIYSLNNVVPVQFVGTPVVFAFRKALAFRGPIGPHNVAVFPDFHEFIGQDGEYRFDGATGNRVNLHIWQQVLPSVDFTRVSQSLWIMDEVNGDLVWGLPFITDSGGTSAGTPINVGYSEHYLEQIPQGVPTPYGRRDLFLTAVGYYHSTSTQTWNSMSAITWNNAGQSWGDPTLFAKAPLILVGDINGFIYQYGVSQQRNGIAMDSFITYPLRTIDGRMRCLIKRIYPYINNIGSQDFSMNVFLLTSEGLIMPTISYGPFPIDMNYVSTYFVAPYHRGRYFACKFEVPGPNMAYEIVGYDVDYVPGGMA